jgi:hypothetical protein
MKRELKEAQFAVADSSDKKHSLIERPKKLGNLQAEMSLADNWRLYHAFCVSFFFLFILTTCILT